MSAARIVCLIAGVVLVAIPAVARWDGPQDNKAPTDLERMTDDALFREAFDVCVGRALLAERPSGDESATTPVGSDYLGAIDDVVRQRHEGTAPVWMQEFSTARTARECQRGYHSYLQEPGRSRAPIRATRVPAAASTPPRPAARSRRPPWLAPP